MKVVDFGLAKLAAQTRLTRTGSTLGTVPYMSPEQVNGDDFDRRTDLWALGIIFYEMITGQTPFRGEREAAVAYSNLNEEPRPVTGLRTGIPLELERIVVKCLKKDPAERYQTAAGLLSDLLPLLRGSSEQTQLPRDQLHASKTRHSQRWWS